MEVILDKFSAFFTSTYFTWFRDFLDIALVSYFIYRLLLLIKGTRAVELIKGLLILFIFYYIVNNYLQLRTMAWLMQNAATIVIVAIPIVFQPELRRLLAHIGQDRLIIESFFTKGKDLFDFIKVLSLSVKKLAQKQTGALIVIERNTGLNEFVETGFKIDTLVTPEIMESIFYSGTPLHDGAIIIKDKKIIAASVLLPLSENLKPVMGKTNLGTRHRAGLGLSETTDAICIIVSEETGAITVAMNGKLYRHLNEESLEQILLDNLQVTPKSINLSSLLNINKLFSKKSAKENTTTESAPPVSNQEENSQKKTEKKSNMYIKFTSIIVAAFFMLMVIGKGLPEKDSFRTFVLPIRIRSNSDLNHNQDKLKLVPSHVNIKVNGSQEILDNVKVEDIKVFVNLNKIQNNQRLYINALAPTNVTIKEIDPKFVTINIEK